MYIYIFVYQGRKSCESFFYTIMNTEVDGINTIYFIIEIQVSFLVITIKTVRNLSQQDITIEFLMILVTLPKFYTHHHFG